MCILINIDHYFLNKDVFRIVTIIVHVGNPCVHSSIVITLMCTHRYLLIHACV